VLEAKFSQRGKVLTASGFILQYFFLLFIASVAVEGEKRDKKQM